jgi:RNA polymerase sigma factor (TIGR02999 family)
VGDITRILQRAHQGETEAAQELLPLVYAELRQLAAVQMAHEALSHTLQPTALVHEAWLRLSGGQTPCWENRPHFFGAAAEAMRRILIDHARRRNSLKRGGGMERVDLENLEIASQADDDTLMRVDDALEKLAREDPQAAQLIKLRFFVGLTNEQAGRALGIFERTAKRYWSYARAWLYQELQGTPRG